MLDPSAVTANGTITARINTAKPKRIARHQGQARIADNEQAADQQIHHHGEDDRILHADVGD